MSLMPRIPTKKNEPAPIGGESRSTRDAPLARDALRAFLLGGAGAGAAWLVGVKLLGGPYYFAWATVAAMGLYLLLAWLLYLRDDAFMSRPRQPAAERPCARPGMPPSPAPLRRSVRALVMAATLLAILSLVLYFCFGIGAAP